MGERRRLEERKVSSESWLHLEGRVSTLHLGKAGVLSVCTRGSLQTAGVMFRAASAEIVRGTGIAHCLHSCVWVGKG